MVGDRKDGIRIAFCCEKNEVRAGCEVGAGADMAAVSGGSERANNKPRARGGHRRWTSDSGAARDVASVRQVTKAVRQLQDVDQ